MCTVSFIPLKQGYRLGMNRDEQRARVKGIFPAKTIRQGVEVVGPCEPSGGRWIVANSSGITFALLNWYSRSQPDLSDPYSRGKLVDSLACMKSLGDAREAIFVQPLDRIRPFRLLGISSKSKVIQKWQWDGVNLEEHTLTWAKNLWASSGYDELGAQKNRRLVFDSLGRDGLRKCHDMREFHRNHDPGQGALSVCMHRREAATVSYTEVTVGEDEGVVFYLGCPPCEASVGAGAEIRFGIES